MIRLQRVALALGLVVATTGCFRHTYQVGQGAAAGPIVYEEWQTKWIAGLIGETNLDVDQLCPSGNATVHDEQTFLNGPLGVLTGGIFTPTTVRVRCSDGGSAAIDLSAEQVRTILTSRVFLENVETVMPGVLEDAWLGVQAQK